LIVASWRLDDVIQASVGISIVAIPIFLVFIGVVFYVFWGVALHGRKRED
jgi:cbb3-type cytochrome oxidase subunit 3